MLCEIRSSGVEVSGYEKGQIIFNEKCTGIFRSVDNTTSAKSVKL